MDENEARRLLRDADLPPTRIDLNDVMNRGRRQRTRRHAVEFTGAAALALTLTAAVVLPVALRAQGSSPTGTVAVGAAIATKPSAAPSAKAILHCTPSALPASSVPDVTVSLADTSGRYIVGYQSSNTVWRSVLWTDGHPRVLSLPGDMPSIDAVNSQGVLAGDTTMKNNTSYAFRYVNGKATKLTIPMSGSWHYYSMYLNNHGDIISNAEPTGNSGGDGAVTLLWKAGSNLAVKLPLPQESEVFGLTDDGMIAGSLLGRYGYVWDSTGHNPRKLQLPAGAKSSYTDSASVTGDLAAGRASNSEPVKAGGVPAQPTQSWTVLWNMRTGQITEQHDTPDGGIAINGLNAAGSWVGRPLNMSGNGAQQKNPPVLYTSNGEGHLAPIKAGYTVGVIGLTDDGVVIGDSTALKGDSIPTVWHC